MNELIKRYLTLIILNSFIILISGMNVLVNISNIIDGSVERFRSIGFLVISVIMIIASIIVIVVNATNIRNIKRRR